MVGVVANMLLVNTPLSPLYWTQSAGMWLEGSAAYERTTRDAQRDAFLAEHVPPDAPLASPIVLAAHLTNRHTLYLTDYGRALTPEWREAMLEQVDYVVTDVFVSEQEALAQVLRNPAFGLVQAHNGLLLFQRNPPPDEVLPQCVAVRPPGKELPVQARFENVIALSNAQLTPLQGRRFRAAFMWQAMGTAPADTAYVAVSRLHTPDGEPVEGTQTVHLPTSVLHPPGEWQADTLIEETFEVEVPPEVPPGRYSWRVGWYDLNTHEVQQMAEEGMLMGSNDVDVATLEVGE
jgi:hypothetical protein